MVFWSFLFVFSSHAPSSASETKQKRKEGGGERVEGFVGMFLCSSILSLTLFNISQL